LAVEIAGQAEAIRGFGHIKLANEASARAKTAGLLHRFKQPPDQSRAAE
jgi:hypothetical protein